jgi:hypothetical protein
MSRCSAFEAGGHFNGIPRVRNTQRRREPLRLSMQTTLKPANVRVPGSGTAAGGGPMLPGKTETLTTSKSGEPPRLSKPTMRTA